MSADNYVIVRKFGKKDYRWGDFSASDNRPDFSDQYFRGGPFKTPREAAVDARKELGIIEYGIEFEDGCLKGE